MDPSAENADRPKHPETSTPKSTLSQPLRAAKPSREIFDPWNSVSTGHQVAENQAGQSLHWRHLRDRKLSLQFAGSNERLDGLRGVHHKDRHPEYDAAGKRQLSILDALGSRMTKRANPDPPTKASKLPVSDSNTAPPLPSAPNTAPSARQLFSSLKFYINGSTYPTISDHKLKQLLVHHGAGISLGLGQRTVTHVILGRASREGGCGGGLAATKIERDMRRLRGVGSVKFVTVEWVMESVKAGKRLPEARFAGLKEEVKRQGGVYAMFEKGRARNRCEEVE